MRLVAGDPALDFVNTQSGPPHGEPDDDTLRSYPEFLAWAEYAGILREAEAERLSAIAVANESSADEVLASAINLRSALHEIFQAIADDGRQPARAAEALADVERKALAGAVLARRGAGFDWTWPDEADLARPLWLVAHAAVELLRSGSLDRVKGCGGCRFLFVDESKNRSRRWCSMSDCGSASKMQAYVARRAERRAAARSEPQPR